MEVSEGVSQQDRLQLIAEKRKRQTEIENKKRQLEDDKRQLQHLRSKALRERWLLDGAPAGQPEQDDVRRQLTEDENKSRDLENAICRLEQELADLESAVCVSVTHSKDKMEEDQHIIVTSSSSVKVVHEMNGEDGGVQLSSSEVEDLLLKADQVSLNITMTTQHTLETVEEQTSVEVSAVEAASASPEPAAGGPTDLEPATSVSGQDAVPAITGLESAATGVTDGASDPALGDASAEQPVTMVFLGYHSVEDELETKRVLGVDEGTTVQAELVVIQEEASPPPSSDHDTTTPPPASDDTATTTTTQPLSAGKPHPQQEEVVEEEQRAEPKRSHAPEGGGGGGGGKGGEDDGAKGGGEKEEEGGDKDGGGGDKDGGGVSTSQEVSSSKEKQPCKCCSIM